MKPNFIFDISICFHIFPLVPNFLSSKEIVDISLPGSDLCSSSRTVSNISTTRFFLEKYFQNFYSKFPSSSIETTLDKRANLIFSFSSRVFRSIAARLDVPMGDLELFDDNMAGLLFKGAFGVSGFMLGGLTSSSAPENATRVEEDEPISILFLCLKMV